MDTEEAIKDVQYLKSLVAQARVSQARSAPFLVVWGVVWLLVYPAAAFGLAPGVHWAWLLICMLAGSGAHFLLWRRHMRATPGPWPLLVRLWLWCGLVLAGLCLAALFLAQAMGLLTWNNPSFWAYFAPLWVGAWYLLGGFVGGRGMAVLGAWLVVLGMGIPLLAPLAGFGTPAGLVAVGVLGGGALIVTGLFVRPRSGKGGPGGPETREGGPVRNVSETALWVAQYRAMETRRKDALFRDPYAQLLAGERGEEIVRTMPMGKAVGWSMITRTRVFDDLILRLVGEEGVDTVLNLGAGLDTRPYRLPLPGSLRWIEVDLPGILAYKEEKLAGAKPACDLRRLGQDLSDALAVRALFEKIGAGSALVLSEGLLAWLPGGDVAALAASLHQRPSFTWWLLDLMTAALSRWLAGAGWSRAMEAGDTRMQFAPEEGPAFFAPYGWNLAQSLSLGREARRLHREMPLAGLYRSLMPLVPKDKREMYSQLDSFAVLLRRA